MPINIRRAITVAFLLVSIIFMIIIGYTTHLYFTVYVTIRNFGASIPTLNVQVVNSSCILIGTPIIIQNPSQCLLEVTQIMEGLSLENVFILSSSHHGVTLYPESTVNVTINAEVPSHMTQYVMTHLEDNWIASLRIFLSAPIAGGFSWQNSWLVTEVNLTEATPE